MYRIIIKFQSPHIVLLNRYIFYYSNLHKVNVTQPEQQKTLLGKLVY